METTHSFFDDTPTPTRYIRNCDDLSFFRDFQHNPFDETFRIATESSHSELSNVLREPLSKSDIEETLNTPKIITVAKSDSSQDVYSIVEEDDDSTEFIIPAEGESYLIESIDADESSTRSENENNLDDTSEVEIIEEPAQQNGFATHTKISQPAIVNTIVSALTSNNASNITYAISSNPIKSRTYGNYIIQNVPTISSSSNLFCSSVQKAVVTNKAKCEDIPKLNTSSIVKTATTTKGSEFSYQLVPAKLPAAVLSGKNVVILPSRNHLKPSTPVPIRAIVNKNEQSNNADGNVKEKLKNLLKANSSQLVDEPVITGARKRPMKESTNGVNNTIDEKREHSKERNRMAQKRCRMKKKRSIQLMRKVTDQAIDENRNLKNEVSALRAEVAHLKTLLLAHRNCSVTQTMFKADLKVIMNSDISKIADNVEISVPDSTEDSDETRIKFSSVVTHQQVNQVNHHVNHIHVHIPSAPPSSEETLESACVGSKYDSSSHEIKLQNSQLMHNRKLIFDSKVVPIKPDDRCALVRHKVNAAKMVRANLLTMRNTPERRKQFSVITTDSRARMMSDSLPMQSTEVSASTNGVELEQFLPQIGNVIKYSSGER